MLKIKETSFIKCMHSDLCLIELVTNEIKNGIQLVFWYFTNLKMNKFVIYMFLP